MDYFLVLEKMQHRNKVSGN